MPSSQPLVLVIEDEPQIRKFLRATLTAHGHRVNESATGKDGLAQAGMQPPEVVILDLGLPDIDGFEVTRQLRSWTTVPIIVLSARGMETDKIAALDAGADDYLTKPFGVGELMARIRVALRHSNAIQNEQQTAEFTLGRLHVDLSRRAVKLDGSEVHLTPIEYSLLALLIKHAGKVLTHKFLLTEVWGPTRANETQYLRIYMANLRHKLERDPAQPQLLLTEPGVGYRLRDQVE
jgi:two-component system, OmpR family, KDP operon response regulator KdpE